MPFIVITGRKDIDRRSLVKGQQSQEPTRTISARLENWGWGEVGLTLSQWVSLLRWPVVNLLESTC